LVDLNAANRSAALLKLEKLVLGMRNIWQGLSLFGRVGLIVLLLLIVMAAAAPYITWQPHNNSSGPALVPPGGAHLLGTDELGVDLWAQICFGARVSLLVGLGTALLAGIGGGIIGTWAGYRGGFWNAC